MGVKKRLLILTILSIWTAVVIFIYSRNRESISMSDTRVYYLPDLSFNLFFSNLTASYANKSRLLVDGEVGPHNASHLCPLIPPDLGQRLSLELDTIDDDELLDILEPFKASSGVTQSLYIFRTRWFVK